MTDIVGDVDLGRPHRAVVAGLDGDVLVLLAGLTRPLSGREIAARLGSASFEGVRRSLERLVGQGIVLRERAGSAYMHTLNREHLGSAAVLELAGMRTALWERLRTAVGQWQPPAVHVSAFGSAARGDGDSESDVDLLVVRSREVDADDEAWRRQIEALERDVRAWTGNEVSVIEQDEAELAALSVGPPRVLEEIRRDAIDLAGVPARTLLRLRRGTA